MSRSCVRNKRSNDFLTDLLFEENHQLLVGRKLWNGISNSPLTVANKTIGFRKGEVVRGEFSYLTAVRDIESGNTIAASPIFGKEKTEL